MKHASLVRFAVALATIAGLGATGCAKKVTDVDSGYQTLEGVQNANLRLVVWPDEPIPVSVWDNTNPAGSNDGNGQAGDQLLRTRQEYVSGPSAVLGQVFDGTSASSMQVYRREPNGGLRQLGDFSYTSTKRWLDSHWEMFAFTDTRPVVSATRDYFARGIVSGAVTATSPVSQRGTPSGSVPRTIVYPGNRYNELDPIRFPTDSLFTMRWSGVPGAQGYWLHVFQLTADTPASDKQRASTPSPVLNGKVRDMFIGFVAAPDTSYRLGSPNALILTRRTTLIGQEYWVRVTAVSPEGRVLATMLGDSLSTPTDEVTNEYERFPMGAVKIVPRRATTP